MVVFNNGIILCFGRNQFNANTWTYITLPISFSNVVYIVLAATHNHCDGSNWGLMQSCQPHSQSQCKIASAQDNNAKGNWFCIGY